MHSVFKLWEALLNDTKQHSKYHQVASDVCSKYVADRFDDIIDDIKRIFAKVCLNQILKEETICIIFIEFKIFKCKNVGQTSHEEIFNVVGELNAVS